MNIIGFTFTFNQPGGSGFRINIPSAQQYPPMYSQNEQIHYLKVLHCYVPEGFSKNNQKHRKLPGEMSWGGVAKPFRIYKPSETLEEKLCM